MQRLHVNPRDTVGVKLTVSSPPRSSPFPNVAPVFASADSFTSAIDIARGGTAAVNSSRFSLEQSETALNLVFSSLISEIWKTAEKRLTRIYMLRYYINDKKEKCKNSTLAALVRRSIVQA